jgi:hypothetical protein
MMKKKMEQLERDFEYVLKQKEEERNKAVGEMLKDKQGLLKRIEEVEGEIRKMQELNTDLSGALKAAEK